ncbi:acyl-protein synthetase LuxE [Lachnotalea glycerini]|uniref:Acyl-protein synthetase n=1 Tax=Lachnotalea glycerini TaxID=1763509 RepID=A0A255IM83_9FIRM|nr:acyl-protein synthetase [Lachnotalea glycerini]PXV95640.1 acyl-protein synthetase LuxE [Lachnotalea glycerini]RDY32928.1 acyl-protein synthetase [Lachnotalea glycerini]
MENFFEDFRDNLLEQYDTCPAYKYLCDNQGFDPNIHLNKEEDMESVPFIATTLFKKSAQMFTSLLRVPLETIDKWTVSSSTSGDPSIVGRRKCDLMQMERFNELNRGIFQPGSSQECVFYPEPEVMKSYKSEMIYGKRTESYMGNLLDSFHFNEDAIFFVKQKGNELMVDLGEFKRVIKTNDGLSHHLSLRGSTPLIYNAVNELKDEMEPVKLGANVLVHTGGGGWDGKKGTITMDAAIQRKDFVECVSQFLGIPEENFIDSYSFTENSFPITGHYSPKYKDYLFHIPKWGQVIIRDIKTLKPLHNPGDIGFIQMLNAYGTSTFAGASIIVDDIGQIVSMDECPDCKEKCMTIKIIGRVKGAEAKGCGATLNVEGEKQ